MAANESWTVYSLTDPRNGRTRYIGITKNTLNNRLKEHLRLDGTNKHKDAWISQCGVPVIEPIVENVSFETACELEIYLIASIDDLTNQTRGGEAVMRGRTHTQETKNKMSAARGGKNNSFFGKKHSEQARIKMSALKKGKPSWNKGVPCSTEKKKKISDALKGNIPWNKGKITGQHSEERRRITALAIKRWWAERKKVTH